MQIKWAIKENINEAEEPTLQDFNTWQIFWLGIATVFKHTHNICTIDLENPTQRQTRKVELIKRHIGHGGWLDPPHICEMKNTFIRIEGKHRLLAAHQLGEIYAPLSVKKKDVQKIIALLKCG